MEFDLSFNTPISSSTLNYTSGGQSSSKFRGVIWLRSGKWGSRIAFKYKAFWLGTYDMEEEAAMAYDRAAIKLQRSDAPLNFPMSAYSVEETRFQGQFSNEEILEMIKDKTYLPRFADFLAGQRPTVIMNPSNRNGEISRQLLFRKELTQTDVTHVKGLHIPKEYAMQHFPPLAEEGERRSVELTFYDKHRRPWTFRYSFWKSTQTFVFTKGWRHFLRMNSLKPRDLVFFYRCEDRRANQGDVYYMIDVQSYGAVGQRSDAEEMDEEEADGEVMLFGVSIGKGSGENKRKRADE